MYVVRLNVWVQLISGVPIARAFRVLRWKCMSCVN